jgi:uncharacterized oxidoreductase
VPFGGRQARLGTNPISVAFPSDLEGPIFLDMATSAVAAGKLSVQRNRRQPAPPGWIVDKDGNPTTDVEAYYAGGAILPMGGDQAHKGYVLSFMVETLSGILTGLGFGVSPTGRHNDGTFLAVFDVNAFLPLREVQAGYRRVCRLPQSDATGCRVYGSALSWRVGISHRATASA